MFGLNPSPISTILLRFTLTSLYLSTLFFTTNQKESELDGTKMVLVSLVSYGKGNTSTNSKDEQQDDYRTQFANKLPIVIFESNKQQSGEITNVLDLERAQMNNITQQKDSGTLSLAKPTSDKSRARFLDPMTATNKKAMKKKDKKKKKIRKLIHKTVHNLGAKVHHTIHHGR